MAPKPMFVVAQPTVTLIVPQDARSLGRQMAGGVLVVQFRTKHERGIGIPGETYDSMRGNILYHAKACGREELGLRINPTKLSLFIIRDGARRDVRSPVTLEKINHRRRLPKVLARADVNGCAEIAKSHRPDLVYIYNHDGVIDASKLRPADSAEVERVVVLERRDIDKIRLPISDDRALLHYYYDTLRGSTTRPRTMILPQEYLDQFPRLD